MAGFQVSLQAHALELPLSWKKPQTIFVNSMSDLFHENVPDEFLRRAFDVMQKAPWHTFQVLTKRAERLAELAERLEWPPNVWIGVSVENAKYVYRIDHLRRVPAAVRFVSFEPLLRSVGAVDLRGIQWVIVGGESGPKARAMAEDWALELRDACVAAGVPFFFKQWGGVNKKKAGRLLGGRTWDQLPPVGAVLGGTRASKGATECAGARPSSVVRRRPEAWGR